MKFKNAVTVYLKELKDSLRDRRTLLSMIVIPAVVVPALSFTVIKVAVGVMSKVRDEASTIMILGGDDSPDVVSALKQAKQFRVLPWTDNWRQQISDKNVRAAVEIPEGFAAGLKAGVAAPVIIYHYENQVNSSLAAADLERFFSALREKSVVERLVKESLPVTLVKPFETRRENVAPPEKVGGNMIGGFVPYLIIILCLTGAAYPAMDLTAGEKERGTMETLLCSPASRVEIVLGKFLMVLTSSLSAMVLALLSMALTFSLVGAAIAGRAGAANVAGAMAKARAASAAIPSIDPAGVVGVIGMVFPIAVLFSAVTFTVSLFAKTQKEAQTYLTPMMFVVMLPAVIGILPGIDLNARLALVPLLNLSLVCKEMLSGVWHWNYIGLIFGSSCVYAAAALAIAVKMFNREDVLFRT